MTKGQLIEQIYLAVNGGRLTPDASVQREDISNILPAALSFATDQYIRRRRQEDRAEMRAFGTGGLGSYTSEFSATYYVTPEKDEKRPATYRIDPPTPWINMGGMDGIRDLRPVGGDSYAKAHGALSLSGITESLDITFFWAEIENGKKAIFIRNIGVPVCEHILEIIADANAIGIDDDLPVSETVQFDVIRILTEFFLNQRSIPEDLTMSDEDTTSTAR